MNDNKTPTVQDAYDSIGDIVRSAELLRRVVNQNLLHKPKQEQLLLSKGEKALIEALRTYTIERSYCSYEGRILGVNYDDEDVVSLSIGIKLKRPHPTPVEIREALDKIKAEQTTSAEMYHSLAS